MNSISTFVSSTLAMRCAFPTCGRRWRKFATAGWRATSGWLYARRNADRVPVGKQGKGQSRVLFHFDHLITADRANGFMSDQRNVCRCPRPRRWSSAG